MAIPWLTNEFLKKCHKIFANEFYKAGIFKCILPLPDFLEIKYGIKSFGGQFCVKRAFNGTYATWIRITPYCDNTTKSKILSVYIHEMIHYYIYYQKIVDTSSHGIHFKNIMHSINNLLWQNNFFGLDKDLLVSVRGKIETETGEGYKTHALIIWQKDYIYYCSKINSKKIAEFTAIANRSKRLGYIMAFGWFTSKDKKFDTYQQCNKKLSGYKIGNRKDLKDFIETYNISKLTDVIEEL